MRPKNLPYGSYLEYFGIDGTPWFAFYSDDNKIWVYEWDGLAFDAKMPIMGAAS